MNGFAAKFYQITGVNIQAVIDTDGSMTVTESRTYRFRGTYQYAYRNLPTAGIVRFADFQVSESGSAYRQSDSGEPGTFRIIEQSGTVEVRWFFRAANESRTFDFQYRAERAIERYEDAALFYFQFIGSDWDHWQKQVRLRLKPPDDLESYKINAWLHGPLCA